MSLMKGFLLRGQLGGKAPIFLSLVVIDRKIVSPINVLFVYKKQPDLYKQKFSPRSQKRGNLGEKWTLNLCPVRSPIFLFGNARFLV